MRRALWSRPGRRTARFVPCADELRRRSLQAAAETVAAERVCRAPRTRGVPAVASERTVAHAAVEARAAARGSGRSLSARAAGKPAVFRGKERATARTV